MPAGILLMVTMPTGVGGILGFQLPGEFEDISNPGVAVRSVKQQKHLNYTINGCLEKFKVQSMNTFINTFVTIFTMISKVIASVFPVLIMNFL